MSRRNDRARREERRAKKKAFEDFEEAFPWRGSHTPLFVYQIMEASVGREATIEYKRQRDEERFNSVDNQLNLEKLALLEKFKNGAWREGVEGLGVRGWGRNKPLSVVDEEELKRKRAEKAKMKKDKKANWGPESVEYVDSTEEEDSGVIQFTPKKD